MNRTAIMNRAWAIFRETYGYRGKGGIPFLSIGRKCFAWSLRQAWREAREAAARTAIPADVKAARVASLKTQLSALVWMKNYRQAEVTGAAIRAELRLLAA